MSSFVKADIPPSVGLGPFVLALMSFALAAILANSMSIQAEVPAEEPAAETTSEPTAATARIEGRATLTANVGMMAKIQQVFFPGTELIPRTIDSRTAPVVIRIDAAYPHGDGFRYDLTWSAYESGVHDLTKYLARRDGTSTEALASLEVTANSLLPPGRIAPNAPELESTFSVGGYRTLMWMAAILWTVGLAVILIVGRKKTATGIDESADSPRTRLDSIRLLLQQAASGSQFSAVDKARLEGLILGFWREHKQIQDLPAQMAFARLRDDPDAGPLLKQIERWLYDRAQLSSVDLTSLLQPLQVMVERAEQSAKEPHR